MPKANEISHVSLKNISKEFASSGIVLKNLNLEIAKGDFTVILGPSGSGKSTLLRLIAELDNASSGELKINHYATYDKAFVFQEAQLMPWRSLIENVALPLELMKTPLSQRLAKAREVLKLVQLSESENLHPDELSGGMKMRASLARALIASPSLLLMDEPFAALDEQTRFKLADDLRRLWFETKMTVVFVTHSVVEACFLANRILTLSGKPAHIEKDIHINLPIERTQKLRTEAEFNSELKRIYRELENSTVLNT